MEEDRVENLRMKLQNEPVLRKFVHNYRDILNCCRIFPFKCFIEFLNKLFFIYEILYSDDLLIYMPEL